MQKTLTILRHAKTEPGSAAQEDHARQLTERGIKATAIVGKHLIQQGINPGKVLCSTAIRTTETFLKIEHYYKHPLPVEYNKKLYLASAGEILNVIDAVDDSISSLMIVAHNPGVHELSMKLARSGDEALIDKMAIKFPTCAAAIFSCDIIKWADLKLVGAKLLSFASPKMLGQIIDG